ncbi:hypothetical protein H7X68_01495 [Candidatus Saccharibacteria bacterium]|nr:hypothetical protein [Candidatus Saccharibacteria bacterium]
MGNFRSWLSGAKITGGLIALGIVVLLIATLVSQPARVSANTEQKPSATATATTKAPTAPAAAKPTSTCDKKFVQVAGNNASNRVDAAFATKYAKATASANNMAKAQKSVLLENSANNGQRLAIWSNAFGLYSNPNDWKPLVRGNCLSSEGQKLYYRLEGTLSAKGVKFEESQAPAGGSNTGVNRGTYGVSVTPGITGNTKAIKVTLSDGSFVTILVRCGNVVFPSRPNLPKVPTDNPEVPAPPAPPRVNPPRVVPPRVVPPRVVPPRVVPPRVNPPRLAPKIPSEDPAPRGNAPTGGGRNQDPGPGTYIPPSQMERPPATPRRNPAPPVAPAPAPRRAPAPPVGSTPDPAPAPAPEPSAPTPADPATGCSPPPGMTTC